MTGPQVNHISSKVLIFLSLTALLAVVIGYAEPPQPDEGAAAHLFQLSITALVPSLLVFLATADWKQSLRSARLWHFQPPLWLSRLEPCITLNTTDKLRLRKLTPLLQAEAFVHQSLQARPVEDVVRQLFIRKHA